jgi:hypothetical protein
MVAGDGALCSITVVCLEPILGAVLGQNPPVFKKVVGRGSRPDRKDGGLLYENATEKKQEMKRAHNSTGQQPSSNGRAPASLAVPRGEPQVVRGRGRVYRAAQ